MTKVAKRLTLAPLLAVGFAGICFAPEAALAKPAAGPETVKCGKFKKKAQKKRCLKQNKANRIAFNQIKNSQFVGTRGDGEGIEDIFCANGKLESRSTGSYGTGISTDKRWSVAGARVKQGGKWINAFVKASEGFEIALQRRGNQWRYGVASLGRILYPGDVIKTNATKACQGPEV